MKLPVNTDATASAATFITRTQHLAKLQAFLDRAMRGNGQVCFVMGEPGAGKTSLIAEFTRAAQQRNPNLVVAFGDCNAMSGGGDAYLPFREIMTLLLGDVDHGLAEGNITHENATRLRRFFEFTREALIENGPDIVGIFVPGGSMLARLGAKFIQPEAKAAQRGVDQSQVLHQFTSVLRKLAQQQPLILVLDDLHWADAASINLLFHLSRRVEGTPVLIIGTFRPHEIAEGRGTDRHPLAAVVNEVKRYYGEIEIDLDNDDEAERRLFVDQLLDMEPNDFSRRFRDDLLAHTDGHPLFTVELLNSLKERGTITRTNGRWVVAERVDWRALPGRVEGVIAERVERLPANLRSLLVNASVEGEQFAVEILAASAQMPVIEVVRMLSEGHQTHRILKPFGVRRDGTVKLSQFRFAHNLFQTYLYGLINDVERPFRHEAVADAIERVYGARAATAAVQLARHYDLAENITKAIAYYQLAGEAAFNKFAHQEALELYNRGLALAESSDDADARKFLPALHEGIGDVNLQLTHGDTAMEHFRTALALLPAGTLDVARIRRKMARSYIDRHLVPEAVEAYAIADAALEQVARRDDAWWYEWADLKLAVAWLHYFHDAAKLQNLIEECESHFDRVGTPGQRANFLHIFVMAALRRERYRLSMETVEATRRFVEATQQAGDVHREAIAQFQMGFCLLWSPARADAEAALLTGLELSRRVGTGFFEILSLTYLAVARRFKGDVEGTEHWATLAEQAARGADNRTYIASALANRGWALYKRGQHDDAAAVLEEPPRIWLANEIRYPLHWMARAPMAAIHAARGDFNAAAELLGQIIAPDQQALDPDLESVIAIAAATRSEPDVRNALRAAERHQLL